jgi:argininosuccinate synthase
LSKEKVALAYSGGLDTSVAIKWLGKEHNFDVIALAVDVGQKKELSEARERALEAGAMESLIIDAREEFARDFILPALQANALYEGKYPLVSALSRPLISKHLVEVARSKGASYLAHGCTGKGNDQVRFEVSFAALAPDLKVIAPVREWGMSRKETIDYAHARGVPIRITKESPYSIDENLWGRTAECGILEDPWVEPPADVFELTQSPGNAPAEPQEIEVGFSHGKPVSLNGENMDLIELISRVSSVAGGHGFGRVDMVENRLVGIKSRELYEVPAALTLIMAHRDLEDLTLERDLLHFKPLLEQKYAELVYYGLWYSPLKKALDAFFADTQKHVTGAVRLKFFKGTCTVIGRRSEQSLYDYALATYETEDQFSHQSAKGFVELWGLPIKIWAKREKRADPGSKRNV